MSYMKITILIGPVRDPDFMKEYFTDFCKSIFGDATIEYQVSYEELKI